MKEKDYIELTLEMIEAQTEQDAEAFLKEKEAYAEQKLIPEIRKELAVREMQEKQLERIESEIAVMNLASEFTLRIKGGEYERALSCFALKTEGVSSEITNIGIYEGEEALRSYYIDYLTKTAGDAGYFKMNHICTPVVEVAQDNESAKGMWISVGMEALKRPDLPKEFTDPLCVWAYGPWAMDFVKEDGAWKILHLRVYEDVRTIYEKSWSEMASTPLPLDPITPDPSRKSAKNQPFSLNRKPVLFEEPPVPYVTSKM